MILAGVLPADSIHAETYPAKPVRLIVPQPAGGTVDRAARLLAQHLSAAWREPVIVENRPGANGLIAAMTTARAAPDGYTILITSPSLSTFKVFVRNPGVEPLRDLVPVSLLCVGPYNLAISAAVQANSVGELIAYAKSNPGKLNYAAVAGGQLLATELFKQMAGVNIVRVQYRGEAAALTGLATNEVQLILASAVTIQPMVALGKVKRLAVAAAERVPTSPEIPTVAENGLPGFEASVWFGILAPARTPEEILHKIADEIAAFVKNPDSIAQFRKFDYTLKSSSPEEFSALISSEISRWAAVAKRAGIQPE
jgi:tripartite-type tricarboxylate transporter receptor subunit TctC